MARVVFRGMKYEIPEEFTHRELGFIKQIAKVAPKDLAKTLREGDAEFIAVLGWISARRAGATLTVDDFLDSTLGEIDIEDDKSDDPPAEAEAGDNPEGDGQ